MISWSPPWLVDGRWTASRPPGDGQSTAGQPLVNRRSYLYNSLLNNTIRDTGTHSRKYEPSNEEFHSPNLFGCLWPHGVGGLYISLACDSVESRQTELFTDALRRQMLEKSNLRYVKNLPGTLPLHRGMRMLLYDKICVRLLLMHGCACILEDIIFAALCVVLGIPFYCHFSFYRNHASKQCVEHCLSSVPTRTTA